MLLKICSTSSRHHLHQNITKTAYFVWASEINLGVFSPHQLCAPYSLLYHLSHIKKKKYFFLTKNNNNWSDSCRLQVLKQSTQITFCPC